MKYDSLDNMTKGWFVGNFIPSVLDTKDVEVAVKEYKRGDSEAAHYHKIATEITVVVRGKIRMGGREFGQGEIVVLSPGEITDFFALTDVITVVVKHPGASNDKYVV